MSDHRNAPNEKFFAGAAVLLAVLVVSSVAHAPLLYAYEKIQMSRNPSAARAYQYGSRHFNASNPSLYDIQKAESFFNEALALDPKLPYLQHQLGRIAFLKSSFALALARLDLEIAGNGNSSPSSYYMRGLIEGFMGDYDAAIRDYEVYLSLVPANWAAINDYAWVLLKANRAADAATALERGLGFFPENAWLLNTSAVALHESGDIETAYLRAKAAVAAAADITEEQWLTAYPGNDPKIAYAGIRTLQISSASNMHKIGVAYASSTVQSM